MLTLVVFVNIFLLNGVAGVFNEYGMSIEYPGPRYPPTKGEIWPRPQVENKSKFYFSFDPKQFKFVVTGNSCRLLTAALHRKVYQLKSLQDIIRYSNHDNRDASYSGQLNQVEVMLTKPCEKLPYFDMDEAYNLTINSMRPLLQSDSIWGIMLGLESFVQLVYVSDNYDSIMINGTAIIDYPRYPHRGLLLDTSRHFISIKNIELTLDAMAMNKMNVFHWHIVDDQSFPYVSERFPELSKKGAYHESMVYTKEDIASLVNYARYRGIRVIPEFDVPGHTRSWGQSHPELLTECFSMTDGFLGFGAMNPVHNRTYAFLQALFEEVQQRFPDTYFHIGGDEVETNCWLSNPIVIEYMRKHNIDSACVLHALFMERTIPLLKKDTTPIVWQEVFDENVELPINTLVQVWKGTPAPAYEMAQILDAGFKVLISSGWYLDHLASDGDWTKYYNFDPRLILNNDTLAPGIVGGEACMWGEVVDDNNVISRVWPRASAVAEKLWSPYALTPNTARSERVYNRLEEHTCRMIRQGIKAQPPNGPGFCVSSV